MARAISIVDAGNLQDVTDRVTDRVESQVRFMLPYLRWEDALQMKRMDDGFDNTAAKRV